ncbi:MAG: CHASE2 domain-containing protein [Candidatus Omnitrophota bacterium]|jgi:diguanylate cyclase (GGDEF)-like protein
MTRQANLPGRTAPGLKDFFTRSERSHFYDCFEWPHLALCFVILCFFAVMIALGPFRWIENIFYDAFMKHRPSVQANSSVVVIEIDEESIKAIGPWPWPWHYHARMIDLLAGSGAKAIVFDTLFRESGLPYESRTIEESLRDKKPFYLPVQLEARPGKKIWVHSLPIVLEPEGSKKVWAHSIRDIEKFSAGLGHLNLDPDSDGVLRRIRPYLRDGEEGYWYLPVRVAYDAQGRPLAARGDFAAPTDEKGDLLIPWLGPWEKTFQRYSYEELIRGFQSSRIGMTPQKVAAMIKDKICLVGVTAPDLAGIYVSPVEAAYPSLGVQATVLSGVLDKRFVVPVPLWVNLVCLAAIGVIATVLFAILSNIPSLAAGLSLGGIWLAAAFWLFCWKGLWLFVFHPLALILVLFVVSAAYGQIVASREHSRLFDLATRDGLTGVYVIRHFREILNQIVGEAQGQKEPLSLILIDIDNFKGINDKYGHPAGDMVLKKTAHLIRSCLRSERPIHQTDFVARYGGEEFIVLLRNIGLEAAAARVGERIRRAIEGAVFSWKDVFIHVTISLGVATLRSGECVPDPMVHRADEALYDAKRTGKNRVCMENSGPAT